MRACTAAGPTDLRAHPERTAAKILWPSEDPAKAVARPLSGGVGRRPTGNAADGDHQCGAGVRHSDERLRPRLPGTETGTTRLGVRPRGARS